MRETLGSTGSEERDPPGYTAGGIFAQSPPWLAEGRFDVLPVCRQALSQTDGRNLGFYVAKKNKKKFVKVLSRFPLWESGDEFAASNRLV